MPSTIYPTTDPETGCRIHRDASTGFLISTDPATGERWYVTECCHASAKGSVNSPTGVCCRACYREIDPALGAVVPREGTYAHDGDPVCRGDRCDGIVMVDLRVHFCKCSCHGRGAVRTDA